LRTIFVLVIVFQACGAAGSQREFYCI